MHVKLNRANKMNALFSSMYKVIQNAVAYAATADEVKAVIIYGSNGVFCAGNDLDDFIGQEPASLENSLTLMKTFYLFPKPLFFFVQNCCVGVISTLCAHADFLYCSEDAFFLTPFQQTGLCPEGLSSLKFPQIMGRRKASEMLLLDHRLTA